MHSYHAMSEHHTTSEGGISPGIGLNIESRDELLSIGGTKRTKSLTTHNVSETNLKLSLRKLMQPLVKPDINTC